MEKPKITIQDFIFNVAETVIIALMGTSLNVPISSIILVLLSFLFTRAFLVKVTSKKALHFKTWYRCLIWSALVMLSLFVLLKVDLVIAIVFAIFAGYIMTTKANTNESFSMLTDLYLWKSADEPSKYQDIDDYILYNEYNDKLIEFENKIKHKSNLEYLIYKYRFKDHKTFADMSDLLNMDNPRIVEQLDKIAFAIRLYCGI